MSRCPMSLILIGKISFLSHTEAIPLVVTTNVILFKDTTSSATQKLQNIVLFCGQTENVCVFQFTGLCILLGMCVIY